MIAAPALLLMVAISGALTRAGDIVHFRTESGGTARIAGTVLDYTGRQLVIVRGDESRMELPGDRVLDVETDRNDSHAAADELLARHRYAEAQSKYADALDDENRRWVRRLLIARMVVCLRESGRPALAGQYFVLLAEDDPQTPYFDSIPLAWVADQPSFDLERRAREWIDREQSPVAMLLGASHLLTSVQQVRARARLEQLTAAADARVRQLAAAQLWRTAITTADAAQIDAWAGEIEQMPASLRGGPYYVLGRALLRQEQYERAALALLRVPLVYGDDRLLAARALLESGEICQRRGRPDEAVRLYQEIVDDYPEQPLTRAAGEALEALRAAARDTRG